jgi:Kelch motif protein
MRPHLRLLPSLTLGALSLALASCGDQLTQPTLPAEPPPVAAASAPAPDTWIPRAADPVDRVGFVTATVPNAAGQSIVYVVGGWNYGNAEGKKLVEAYNVATNTWSRKRDLPIGLTNFNGAGVIGGKIYIPGGQKKNGGWSTYTLFVYDPAKDTWSQRAGMPVRGATGVVGVIGDKLYLAQPSEKQAGHSDFFRYDPATNKWATLPSPKHAYHMGGVLYDKLYLVNTTTEMYDPATNQWTDKAPAPAPDPGYGVLGTAATARGKLYVFLTDVHPRHTVVYAPLSDSWTVRGPGPIPWESTATRVFVDGRPRIEVIGTFSPSHYQYVP